jgi:starch phosphorylase
MAHLAVVGSHKVNGVAALDSELLKKTLFADFNKIYPGKLTNVTNGITPRRWPNQANPELMALIMKAIGSGFQKDLSEVVKLTPLSDDKDFRKAFRVVKKQKKQQLADKIELIRGVKLDSDALFDV